MTRRLQRMKEQESKIEVAVPVVEKENIPTKPIEKTTKVAGKSYFFDLSKIMIDMIKC